VEQSSPGIRAGAERGAASGLYRYLGKTLGQQGEKFGQQFGRSGRPDRGVGQLDPATEQYWARTLPSICGRQVTRPPKGVALVRTAG